MPEGTPCCPESFKQVSKKRNESDSSPSAWVSKTYEPDMSENQKKTRLERQRNDDSKEREREKEVWRSIYHRYSHVQDERRDLAKLKSTQRE